jgi:hypothetical protein
MVSLKDMIDMQYGTENERRILLTASLARCSMQCHNGHFYPKLAE